MDIGIKYCGGCNSRYDRGKEVRKLIAQFPQHSFSYAAPDKPVCDVWLVVCGCSSRCASTAELIATKQTFILSMPKDFQAVVAFLQQPAAPPNHVKKLLHIGDTATMTKNFTTEDIAVFAKLTGDYGKIHLDNSFAAQYGFGQPVVHGVLTGSLLSAAMGMYLPGDGTVLLDEQLHFHAPVYVGDTIFATVTLQSVEAHRRFYIGELTGCCQNQHGDSVATGTYHQLLWMNLFTIAENTKE